MLALQKINLKIWISGEIWHEIDDAFQYCLNTIEPKINKHIENGNYGIGLRKWTYIAIILNPEIEPYYPEIKRYSKRKTELEFRLKIDYEAFKKADLKTQLKLFSESVLRSVKLMREMKIKDFDIDRLEADVTACLANYL